MLKEDSVYDRDKSTGSFFCDERKFLFKCLHRLTSHMSDSISFEERDIYET